MASNENDPHIPDELLSAYLDGELTAGQRQAIEARLASDPAARQLVEELKAVSQAVRDLPKRGAHENLQEAILQKIENSKASPRSTDGEGFSSGRSSRGWAWAFAAIAASLFVMVYRGGNQPDTKFQEVAHQSELPGPLEDGHASIAKPAGGSLGGVTESTSIESFSEISPPKLSDTSSRSLEMPPSATAASKAAPAKVVSPYGSVVADEISSNAPDSPVPTLSTQRGLRSKLGRALSSGQYGRPIVVQLTMPAESRRNRALENVLAQQQIVAVDETDESGDGSSSTTFGRKGVDQEKSNDTNAIEIVNIEAPLQAITSCLTAIGNDEQNFLKVEVQDPEAEEIESSEALVARESLVEEPIKRLQLLNRGGAVPMQQQAVARNIPRTPQSLQSESIQSRRFQQIDRNLAQRNFAHSPSQLSDTERSGQIWQNVLFVVGTESSSPTTTPKARAN